MFCPLDINECLNSTCGANAVCLNLPGGYACKCKIDFTGAQCDTRKLTVPTFVTVHTFCASQATWVSYGWCLLIQGYFCAV